MAFIVWGKNETHQKMKSNFNFPYIFNRLNLQRCLEHTKKKEPKSCREYAINKSKLSRIITAKHSGTQGQRTVLSKNEEKHLADHLKTLAKWKFSPSKAEVLNVVQDYISLNGFKNNRQGDDWFRGFVHRNNMTVKRLNHFNKADRTP